MLFKKYSDKLNGYWEAKYDYYAEIRNGEITLRDGSKRVMFKTSIKYDLKKLESGEKTELNIGYTTIAANYKGEPMWYITAFYCENGKIYMDSYYTITDKNYHNEFKKVDHDPFYNVLVLDDKYLKQLQGEWVEWRKDKSTNSTIEIKGNEIRFLYTGSVIDKRKFHVIAYRSSPEQVFISDEDLCTTGIGMYSTLDVLPDMLTGYEMVCDMDMPLSVFARRDMLDKIIVPPAAMREPRNTMMCDDPPVMTDPVDDPPEKSSEMKGEGKQR